MSSQAVRNNITTSIRRVITDVKRKAIAEGKKKVMELKDQLLNPDTIIRMLTADINQDSCSIEGRNKLKEKADKLKKQLDDIAEVAEQGLKVMTDLEEKVLMLKFRLKKFRKDFEPILKQQLDKDKAVFVSFSFTR